MDFHDGITCQCFEVEGQDLVQCLLISFCFASEILKKIGPPQPPKKTQKRLMDFHDGISCQCFELEGQDLVQCLLISFCFGSEILKKIGSPQPLKKTKKPQKRLLDFHNGISCQRFELEGWGLVQCLLISFCFGSKFVFKKKIFQNFFSHFFSHFFVDYVSGDNQFRRDPN